jgi:uncharacterized phage-associated protein
MIDDPKKFIDVVALCSTLNEQLKEKYIHKAQLLAEDQKRNIFNLNFKAYLMGNHLADMYSGYRNPNFEKFTEMVVFFAEKVKPFKTKMNKLLFYADFIMFKQSCFSISGVRYKAIDMGPVPNNFQSIFEYLHNNEEIDIITTEFPQGYTGEQFISKADRPFKASLFTVEELDVLEQVSQSFMQTSTNDMNALSHLEEGWHKNIKNKSEISYTYAFELNEM